MSLRLENIVNEINKLEPSAYYGRVTAVQGLFIEVSGIRSPLTIGDRCNVHTTHKKIVPCELVSFKGDKLLLMPYGSLQGIGPGCRVDVENAAPVIYPHVSWLGRIVNAFGEAIDGKGPLIKGNKPYFIKTSPPPAAFRDRVCGKVDLGVKAVNTFLTICKGQRMGIFAGSGVGKSTLMSMMAKHTSSDVSVIGLIGERGREAKEFVEDVLGKEGLEKSVLVLATSDESPLMRRQAAYVTMAVAEYFRDLNKDVLCMMDSITRFAMAQREIGLAVGEPPVARGYTPSIYAELPKLLERSGNFDKGSITGVYTVLVEGDDTNEPIADTVRGILDGHIVLSRALANSNHYPAIDVSASISRLMTEIVSDEHRNLASRIRDILSIYEKNADLVAIGAYKAGSNRKLDFALSKIDAVNGFLTQGVDESFSYEACIRQMREILK